MCVTLPRILLLALLLPLATSPVPAEEPAASGAIDLSRPTHKQTELYTPEFNGEALPISTFCLDAEQNFLICSGGKANGGLLGSLFGGNTSFPPQLTKISPDRELVGHVELPFIPTAVNVAPNGEIFVAGAGNIARVSSDLKILAQAENPHIEDFEAYQKKKRTEIEAQVRQSAEQMAEVIKSMDMRIAEIEAIPEDERTPAEKAELTSSTQMKTMLSVAGAGALGGEDAISAQVEATLNQAVSMPSIAVTDQELFVTVSSGYGYEVWRLNHELEEPKRVVRRVRGCCGQLDIQTDGKDLLVAENSRFRVVRFDRDGKRRNQFGSRDTSRDDGFGSCCNPMNMQCCPNGDLLTAESSIGDIKRFSPDGKLLSYIGKASIASGCKQVTLGHDTVRDRFYLYHRDKNALCVLIPMAEAPEFTAEELAAREAREGLGEQLVGHWLVEEEQKVVANPLFSAMGVQIDAPGYLTFKADGRMDSNGGFGNLLKNENEAAPEMEGYETQTGWLAKEQTGDTKITVFATIDRVEQEELIIEFLDENRIRVSSRMPGIQLYNATYKRASDTQ